MRNIRERLVTIYSKNDDTNNYNTQGLGSLPDWQTANVNAKLNGGEFFTGSYDRIGVNADKLQVDNILSLFIDENRPRQRMRIYKATTNVMNNTIEVEAEPIFSDVRRYVGKKFEINNTTANNAFSQVVNNLTPKLPTKYRFVSTSDTIASVLIEDFNLLEFFGGKEGSILDRFKGEFRRDNNTLYHEKRLGRDHKVKLVYTKNLTGLELEVDASTIVVGIYPYISGSSEDEADIQLPEKVIFTEYAETYPNGIVQFVDFKDKATNESELRTQAQQWLKTNVEATKPKISGTVEMIPLKHQKGYEKFVTFNTVELGDGVDVYHPELEDTISARVVEYDYNVLTDSYDKLVVGNVKANFLENMNNSVSDLINEAIDNLTKGGEISDLIEDMVDHQTDLITGNAGGYVLLDPKERPSRILVMDTPDKETAKNVLQINQKGIGFSQTGINGQYTTAWTLDGGFNASFITAGEIVGITIKGSTLISQGSDYRVSINNGKITWHSNKINKDIMELEARDYIKADAGIVSYTMKTGGGFMIRNPNGNLVMSTWDNGNNDPWLSFGATDFLFSNANFVDQSNGGSLRLEGIHGVRWEMMVAGYTMTFNKDGRLTLPGCKLGSWRSGESAVFEQPTVRVDHDFRVSGTKNSTVTTANYGQRLLNAYETPEYYFADYGEAVTGDDCKIRVDIDPIFAETVNLSRYMVYTTPTELVLCAVTHEDRDHFIIETSKPNVLVRWNLVAHRLGYEDVRLTIDDSYDKLTFDQIRF